MKTFNIFVNGDGYIVAVKSGWSWPAFCFSWIWAIVKKMYFVGIAIGVSLVFAQVAIGVYANGICAETLAVSELNEFNLSIKVFESVIWLVMILVGVVFGVRGNGMLGNALCSRGFQPLDALDAQNLEDAVRTYRESNRRLQAPTPYPVPPAPTAAPAPRSVPPPPLALPALPTPPPLTGAPSPAKAPAATQPTVLDQLEKLAGLKDRGILTEEEFTAEKRKLLGL